jgi:hypothetical protein
MPIMAVCALAALAPLLERVVIGPGLFASIQLMSDPVRLVTGALIELVFAGILVWMIGGALLR